MAQQLAVILTHDNRLHNKVLLTKHFNITLATLRRVSKTLNELATPMGLRVHEHSALLGLRPSDPYANNQIASMDRRRANTDGYTITDAKFVYQALRGTLTEAPNHAERPRLGRLIRLNILRPGDIGEPLHTLAEEASFTFEISGVTIDHEYAPSTKPRETQQRARRVRSKSANGTKAMTAIRSRAKPTA
jgi:hypothetical protein